MTRKIFLIGCLVFLCSAPFIQAAPPLNEHDSLEKTIKNAITDLVEDNAAFANEAPEDHFHGLDIQKPRVTMVMCSDSRVQVDNFSQGAENDIFVARNIGNQFSTTQGSIEYGVNVLNTPVLIFVGHSHCGAVKAARGDLGQLAPAIRKELLTMDVKQAPDEKQAVALNIHNQIGKALSSFKDKVNSKKVALIGAIYDFRNDYGYGKGQLIIINLNGEKDPQKIMNSYYFDGLINVKVGI
ncbi:MAG: carbonic anhydrase [Alphaproteobacteria bacterium]|nr:carbonic anhydrase [Alphaproteobacteria bacterium]